MNVPSYYMARQGIAGAARQLDFVLASMDIADQVRVRALNDVNEWGAGDHCRVWPKAAPKISVFLLV